MFGRQLWKLNSKQHVENIISILKKKKDIFYLVFLAMVNSYDQTNNADMYFFVLNMLIGAIRSDSNPIPGTVYSGLYLDIINGKTK